MRKGPIRSVFVALVLGVALAVVISTVPVKTVRAAVPTLQSIEIWPEMDTYVFDDLIYMNYGGASYLRAGYYFSTEFPAHACILIQFPLTLLPPDATISSARLNLTLNYGGGTDLSIMRAGAAWDERTVNWSTKPAPVTSDPVLPKIWSIGTTTLGVNSIDITTWVEDWFGESYANYGLWIQPEPYGTVSELCEFYSKEGASLDPVVGMRYLKMPKLRVTFTSATIVEQPPPPDPPPWLEDYTPPTAEISVSPSADISPDEEVTITVVATDDICLDQVTLMVDLVVVNQTLIDFSILDATEVTIEFVTTFDFGDHHIQVTAKDRVYLAGGDYVLKHVGSRTPPSVLVTCSPEQVLPEDGSEISITVTAEDAEGLKSLVIGLEKAVWDPDAYPDHSEEFVFSEPYPKSFTTTVVLDNVDVPGYTTPQINATRVECLAYARDIEELYTVASDNVSVVRPYQWEYGIPYANPAGGLSWTRYEDTFGHAELWGPGSLEWWKTAVARFWWPIYHVMANNGECFGMSMYSLWHQRNDIPVPDTLTEHVGDELAPPLPGYNEQSYAKRTIERFQGAQISQEILSKYIDQIGDQISASTPIRPFLAGPFQRLQEDLENGEPGVLYMAEYRGMDEGVMECVGAHAVVPWMVVETEPNKWRVYVYDSNRPHTSTVQSTDYDNYEHYPYVDIDETSYAWRIGDELWNDYIWYVSYEDVRKNDYDLMDGWLVAATVLLMIVVVATALAIAGGILVTVQALLPIPLPLPMGAGAQGVALPLGEPYEVTFKGQVDAEYSWAMAADHSTYSIANKTCENGSEDGLNLGLDDEYNGYSMRFTPDVADDDFAMGMSHRIGVEEREYLMENISLEDDGDLQTYATQDGESLVVANHGPDSISLNVMFRSNRSNGQAAMEDIVVPSGKKATISVEWADLANSSVEVELEDIDHGKTPLYTIIIVIGLVVIAAVVISYVAYVRNRAKGAP
jgi:hypothetical protein